MKSPSEIAWRKAHPEKHREYVRRAEKKRALQNRSATDAIKLARGCVDCGYKAHPAALDFDHVHGAKAFGIPTGLTRFFRNAADHRSVIETWL